MKFLYEMIRWDPSKYQAKKAFEGNGFVGDLEPAFAAFVGFHILIGPECPGGGRA